MIPTSSSKAEREDKMAPVNKRKKKTSKRKRKRKTGGKKTKKKKKKYIHKHTRMARVPPDSSKAEGELEERWRPPDSVLEVSQQAPALQTNTLN